MPCGTGCTWPEFVEAAWSVEEQLLPAAAADPGGSTMCVTCARHTQCYDPASSGGLLKGVCHSHRTNQGPQSRPRAGRA